MVAFLFFVFLPFKLFFLSFRLTYRNKALYDYIITYYRSNCSFEFILYFNKYSFHNFNSICYFFRNFYFLINQILFYSIIFFYFNFIFVLFFVFCKKIFLIFYFIFLFLIKNKIFIFIFLKNFFIFIFIFFNFYKYIFLFVLYFNFIL